MLDPERSTPEKDLAADFGAREGKFDEVIAAVAGLAGSNTHLEKLIRTIEDAVKAMAGQFDTTANTAKDARGPVYELRDKAQNTVVRLPWHT